MLIKKIILIIVPVIAITIASCKKQQTVPLLINPEPLSYVYPTVWGVFEADMTVNPMICSIWARISGNGSRDTYAGQILFNDSVVHFNNMTNDYNATSQIPYSINSVCNWKMTGSDSIAGITYTLTLPNPYYNDSLPDSVTISSGLTVPLGDNAINYDSVVFTITTTGNTPIVSKTGPTGTTSIVFSPADLQPINSGDAEINMVLYKTNIQTFGNKQYAFIRTFQVLKSISVH